MVEWGGGVGFEMRSSAFLACTSYGFLKNFSMKEMRTPRLFFEKVKIHLGESLNKMAMSNRQLFETDFSQMKELFDKRWIVFANVLHDKFHRKILEMTIVF